jgi:ribonuclease inhibitor
MIIELMGDSILTKDDFHARLETALDLGPYYGRNLDALWDRLSTDIARPITIIWRDSGHSRGAMGPDFEAILDVLNRVVAHDKSLNLAERFDYVLA